MILIYFVFFTGNGTEDIVRRYPHPSRLFFFSVHLYDKELSPESKQLVYQFYPGSGDTDDNVSWLVFPLLFANLFCRFTILSMYQ